MKCYIGIVCWLTIFIAAGCKKGNTPAGPGPGGPGGPGGGGGGSNPVASYFFKNTEWTGTCATLSQQYSPPCYLRFNGDTAVVVYSLFVWKLNGNIENVDSVVGKITEVDTVTNGVTTIKLSFAVSGDKQVYTITDKKTLKGVTASGSTADVYNTFSPGLQLCPATIPSLKGTSWSSKIMTGGGPTEGSYAYPDLATFAFGETNQIYYRGGLIVTYTPTDHLQELLVVYNQKGWRVGLSGFNESKGLLVGYFGVLAPDGASMYVDTRTKNDARLPNYIQSIYWYGPPGVTPVIYKK
jgi:hypothetical protein